MNISIIGKFDADSFGFHLSYTFQKEGHIVTNIEVGVPYSHKKGIWFHVNKVQIKLNQSLQNIKTIRKITSESLIAKIPKNTDVVLVTHDFLEPGEVEKIKGKTHAPVILWFPDAIVNFRKAMFLDSPYDFIFFKDPYISYTLAKDFYNKKIYYLPECFNPDFHYPVTLSSEDIEKYECDITTVGNLYTNRSAFFDELSTYDYHIKIWGNPPATWMNTSSIQSMLQNEFLTYENKGKAFLGAKIVLNNLHPGEIAGINCRAFEIAGYSGFQMINYRPSINELFDTENEIIVFNNFKDLIEKINYYKNNPEERIRISQQAYKRAKNEHTYHKRLTLLLDTVFKNQKGFPTQFSI